MYIPELVIVIFHRRMMFCDSCWMLKGNILAPFFFHRTVMLETHVNLTIFPSSAIIFIGKTFVLS